MDIGKINRLRIISIENSKVILIDDDDNQIHLAKSEFRDDLKIDDDIEVFIYKDNEDVVVATQKKPNVLVNQFAFLRVKEINHHGTFMDWGLPKDLLVPHQEQMQRMVEDDWYIIYGLRDDESGRLYGTNRVNDHFIYDEVELKTRDSVDLLVYRENDLGLDAVVNDKYKGLIFKSDIHRNINLGDQLKGYVKQVRSDGKIDIVLEPIGYEKSIDKNTDTILKYLEQNDGFIELTDKSSPDDIKHALGMSKKAFKKGIGYLYKEKVVDIFNNGVKLI